MKGRAMNRLIAIPLLIALIPVAANAADTKAGKVLHDKHCTACHIKLFGGDGSEIYTRKEHLIKSRTALGQRVAMCAAQTNSKWFPEDEENVAAYLNEHYYKFKTP
jgi:mono/diheme cytochrome c family protein